MNKAAMTGALQGVTAGQNLALDRKAKQEQITTQVQQREQSQTTFSQQQKEYEQRLKINELNFKKLLNSMRKETGRNAMLSLFSGSITSFNQVLKDPDMRYLFNDYTNVELKEGVLFGTTVNQDGTTSVQRVPKEMLRDWSIHTGAQLVLDEQQKRSQGIEKTKVDIDKIVAQTDKIKAELLTVGTGDPSKRRDALRQFELKLKKAYPNITPEQEKKLYQKLLTQDLAGKAEVKEEGDVASLSANQAEAEKMYASGEFDKQRARELENANYANMDSAQKTAIKDEVKNYKSRYAVAENLDRILNTKDIKLDLDVKETLAANMGKLFGDESPKLMAYIDFKTRTGVVLANFIKELSGTAAAEAEVQRLKEIMLSGDYSDEASVFKALSSFIGEMRDQNKLTAKKLRATLPDTMHSYSPASTQKKASAADFD